MANSKKFFIFVVVLILVIFSWFYFSKNFTTKESVENTSTPSPSQTLKTYKNTKYGFSFSYPEPYELEDFGGDTILIGKSSQQTFNPLVSISIVKGTPEISVQSFEEFVLDQSRILCSTDTSEIIRVCNRIDDVVKIAPFSSNSQVRGQVFYLKGDEINKTTGKETNIRRGPFYTFNTSLKTPNQMSFLIIGNPPSRGVEEANRSLIESVATTLKFF